MNAILRNALVLAGAAFAHQAVAEVTFFEREDFKGRSFNTEQQIDNFKSVGFNDRASSVVVDRDWWQVCEDARFGGRCVVLRPGSYGSLADMGLNDRVSSVRLMSSMPRALGNPHGYNRGNPYLPPGANDDRHPRQDPRAYGNPHPNANPSLPRPVASHDFHRRYNERTYEANVTSARAVVGPPEQRCWVEREQVVQEPRRANNAPGAIVGALLGGILGHQFGSGTGNDLATAGGAVAGAVVGANIYRGSGDPQESTQDVQHCTDSHRYAKPEYWDVGYTFRGQEHRLQMTANPGATVTVNERGEPRE